MHNQESISKKTKISFADANIASWNGLGTTLENVVDTKEAIELAELDFNVIKTPLYVKLGDQYQIIPEFYATVREDINKVLGNVGEKYTIVQNSEAFNFFDSTLQNGLATIQSVGCLGDGERLYISARLHNPIVLAGNDVIEQDLLVMSSHDGKSGTSIVFTPTRALSQTTLNADLDSKIINRKSIKHTSNQLTRIHLGTSIVDLYNSYRNKLETILNKMVETKITEDDYEKIIVAGLADNSGMIKKYFDPNAKQSTRFRNNVKSVLQYAFTHPTQLTESSNMTVFGAYNSVLGWYQNEVDWSGDIDSKMRSIIDTNGRVNLKQQQAFEAALKYTK